MVRRMLLGAVLVCCPITVAFATPKYWYGDVSGSWTALDNVKGTNWSLRVDGNQNTNNLPGANDAVVFSSATNTNYRTVTVAGSPTIDSLSFNSNATNSYTIKSSTLTLNASGGTGILVDAASGDHTISSNITLAVDQSFDIQTPGVADANALLISGKISGGGRHLTKTGGGTLQLTGGLNDYSGGTTISAGLLRINNPVNSSATGSGTVLVDPQGTLGGNGYLTGSIDLKGTIAPGNSIGTLHTGDQNWYSGGHYQLEINAPAGAPGTNWDLLDITGTLDLTSAAGFDIQLFSIDNTNQPAPLSGFDNTTSQSWIIAQTQGITSFSGGLLSVDTTGFANDLAGGAFGVGVDGTNLLLQFTPASELPEPAGVVLIIGAILPLRRRRRN